MNLHEYQAKYLFSKHGLPIPKGCLCSSLRDIENIFVKISNNPWVAKCQIHAGGRGKAGGIKIINDKKDIESFIKQWIGKRLITYQTNRLGQIVNQILFEESILIIKELYLGAIIDRSKHCIVFMGSTRGGINIEQVAEETPNLIHKIFIDPLIGPKPYQGRELAFKLNLMDKQLRQFEDIFIKLAKLFIKYDLSMIEVNPLVITKNSSFICLDAKLSVDDNALFRQSELHKMRDYAQEDDREAYATQQELNYVALNGNIGCMVNGAGLAMGTLDIVKLYGGKPANFLDVGGNATKNSVAKAFKIILLDKQVKAILVNIFGGIVRCDLIADGIIDVISEIMVTIPIVVRLEGNNSILGIQRLLNSKLNIIASTNLVDAVQKVITYVESK